MIILVIIFIVFGISYDGDCNWRFQIDHLAECCERICIWAEQVGVLTSILKPFWTHPSVFRACSLKYTQSSPYNIVST